NQRPTVRPGDRVSAGQVIADGPATRDGELALGRNVLAAFMSWEGYNFEDAIIVSERLVKEDVFTSIHIEELEIDRRKVRNAEAEFTADVPGVPARLRAHLDEHGVARVGSHVLPGDLLVGKVVPVARTSLSPEEALLRSLFGRSAEEVKNASLEVQPGVE